MRKLYVLENQGRGLVQNASVKLIEDITTQVDTSGLAPINNPTFTGAVIVPPATNANEAVNLGQLAGIGGGAIKQIQDFNTYTSLPVSTEQILSVIQIPANFLENGDLVEFINSFYSQFSFINYNVYFNTSNRLTGASLIFSDITIQSECTEINIKGILKNNVFIPIGFPGINGAFFSSASFNPAGVNYLIVTISSSNEIQQNYSILKKIN